MKQKIMIVRVILGEDGSKKGMRVEQTMKGDWGLLEELGAFEVLKQRAYDKLNKKFNTGG